MLAGDFNASASTAYEKLFFKSFKYQSYFFFLKPNNSIWGNTLIINLVINGTLHVLINMVPMSMITDI